MKIANNLFEVSVRGLTVLLYATDKKQAIKCVKSICLALPFSDEITRDDWDDKYGFEVAHMGSKPRDWDLDDEPIIVSLIYKQEF